MSFLTALENETSKRDGTTVIGDVSAFAKWWLENKGGGTESGVNVTETSALTLSYAWSAINVLAQTVGHLPLKLKKKKPGRSGSVDATGHVLFELMKTEPSENTSSVIFRETLEAHRDAWGNAYAEVIGGRHPDDAKKLEILLPDRTAPRVIDGELVFETRRTDGTMRRLSALDVIHIQGLSYNGIAGYSPVQLHKEAIGLGKAALQFGAGFFGRGANARGVIEADVATTNTAEFRQSFNEIYGGLSNSMSTIIMPKGLKYTQISIPPDDAQFLETRKFNRTEIAGIYRVPPHFIMALENATFTNSKEMDSHFTKHTILPIVRRWEQELDRKLLTPKERRLGYFFQFNLDAILRGLPNERSGFYHSGIQDGWLTRNEAREKEDLEITDEALDAYLVPQNMQTAEDILEPLIDSLAERIASVERRELERLGEDVQAVGDFYRRHKEYIRKLARPIARSLERSHGVTPSEFLEEFVQDHLARQMALMIDSVAEAIPQIREGPIKSTFFEVLKRWTSKRQLLIENDDITPAP